MVLNGVQASGQVIHQLSSERHCQGLVSMEEDTPVKTPVEFSDVQGSWNSFWAPLEVFGLIWLVSLEICTDMLEPISNRANPNRQQSVHTSAGHAPLDEAKQGARCLGILDDFSFDLWKTMKDPALAILCRGHETFGYSFKVDALATEPTWCPIPVRAWPKCWKVWFPKPVLAANRCVWSIT